MATSSSKWRAMQRRHKWSYDAVRFYSSRLQSLIELRQFHERNSPFLSTFLTAVLNVMQLTSIHAQVAAMKKVISSFLDLLNISKISLDSDLNEDFDSGERTVPKGNGYVVSETEIFNTAFKVIVEMLFLENSVPLHRSILSCLATLSPLWEGHLYGAFSVCFHEYGMGGPKARSFVLGAVGTSVVNMPKPGLLKRLMEAFAVTITEALCYGVKSVLHEAKEGGRPSPTAIEECQGALSCLYYVLQYYPQKLFVPCTQHFSFKSDESQVTTDKTHDPGADNAVIFTYNVAVDVIIDVLQSSYLSRDCSVAAGVGLCAASQFEASDSEIAIMLANALFATSSKNFTILSVQELACGQTLTKIDRAVLQMRGSVFSHQVQGFTEFGRLCFLRGILTAIPRTSLNFNLICLGNDMIERLYEDKVLTSWTLLFDGILPALCDLCESPGDSHFKFHSVTALQICLQQIKASMRQNITASAINDLQYTACKFGFEVTPYCPWSSAVVHRMLHIVWNNWEDPLNQTVKQIHAIFELLVDIQCLCLNSKFIIVSDGAEESIDQNRKTKEFLNSILKELLSTGGHRKGRYVPLASLTSRLGARTLLDACPSLVFDSINAMVDDDVCCSVGTFLKVFFERLREDCWSLEGILEGNRTFRRIILPPIIAGIVSGNTRLRVNLNTYALPVILQIDSEAILPMLAFALDNIMPKEEHLAFRQDLEGAIVLPECLKINQKVALIIGLLKVARTEALIEGDICCAEVDLNGIQAFHDSSKVMSSVSVKGVIFNIPITLLKLAITHSEDSLRIDAAEALCLNPRTASMPSSLELALLQISIPLNMRCFSTSFRMKWSSLFRKFFVRVRTSIDRKVKIDALKDSTQKISQHGDCPDDDFTCSMPASCERMQSFMKWFCQILIFSIYPSAPYERKSMAMELIRVMLESWSLTKTNPTFPGIVSFMSPDAAIVLMGAIVDSWDKLREGAFKILASYPTPLPGLECPAEVEKVLKWAKALVNSPRVRESDAGALLLRLVFQKYVVQLHWMLSLHPEPAVFDFDCNKNEKVGSAVSLYLQSLNDWLESGIIEGEKNLIKACRHSFVHGALLSYRYTIDEVDWKSNSLVSQASELRTALNRLLYLLTRVTGIALWVVSADALDMPGGIPRMKPFNVDLQSFLEEEDELAINEWDNVAYEQQDDEEMGFLAPSEQAIMVGCWLAMKEVSLLLGTVTRKVPLPGSDVSDMEGHMSSLTMLDLNQINLIGSHFLQVLLSMKHNGAIDKTRAGFVALCNRLLCSEDSRLNKMPEVWLQQLMARTASKGQTVDDLLRRSAGIPAAFLALFLAEPEGVPKKLLFIAMKWLIGLVKSFLERHQVDGIEIQAENLSIENGSVESSTNNESGEDSLSLKARDEGVVPTVHAFNVMRVTFNDTNLSTDTSGFCAESLSLTIQAFSCHHWEVRNAAVLAYTALLRRMVGFLNSEFHDSARRAITCFEFFHRYPLLHSFLLKELQNATSQLDDTANCRQEIKSHLQRTLHPSLAPVLIILSRLKPSTIDSSEDDWLSPSAFMSYVSRCATHSSLKVRILASRALPPLVASDKLVSVLCGLANVLPTQGHCVRDGSWNHLIKLGTRIPSCAISYNTVHGVLLQMHSLLTQNFLSLPSYLELRKDVASVLSPIMSTIDRSKLFSCPTVGVSYLDVLQSLARFENMCATGPSQSVLWNLLLQASSEILDGLYDSISIWRLSDSTKISLKKKACKIYFTESLIWWQSTANSNEKNGIESCHILQKRVDDDQFLKRLEQCVSDCMYEVRLAVLKVLKCFFDHFECKPIGDSNSVNFDAQTIQWATRNILPMVIECLRTETHPHCVRYALLNYFMLSTLQIKFCKSINALGEAYPGQFLRKCDTSVYEMWTLFKCLYHSTKHVKTKVATICCLGICIQQIMQLFHTQSSSESSHCSHATEEWNLVKDVLQFWLEIIQRHCAADELVLLRRATAEAIIASDLLNQIVWVAGRFKYDGSKAQSACIDDWFIQVLLDSWFVCIKLLEDEDTSLRDRLAIQVLHIVSSIGDRSLCASSFDFVPAQVEQVIYLSFDYLSICLGKSSLYLLCLANWIWSGISDTSFMQNDYDLVRRLFDKEIDNHHEEKLLFTQLCCLHLSRLLSDLVRSGGTSEVFDVLVFIDHWRMKFLIHTRWFVEKVVACESRLQWLGGLTNHPDVFRTLYPLLLGLLTFAGPPNIGQESVDKHQQLLTGLADMVEIIRPFIANPLIFNLLFKVLKQNELLFTIDLGSTSLLSTTKCLLVEDFDPFFLLR